MKLIYTAFLISTLIANTGAQTPSVEYIQKNAIQIVDRKVLNDSLYHRLADYKVIFIGELHGTVEPAEFVEGLIKLFLAHHRQVVLGMEIPADQMTDFSLKRTEESLRDSPFFNTKYEESRKSNAWAGLLLSVINTKARMGFFAVTKDQWKHKDPNSDQNGDSLMYENVNAILKQNPDAVFIGICGGFHNMIDTSHSMKPMACYLQNADNTFLKKKRDLLSLDFQCESGTHYNIIRNDSGIFELKVRQYEKMETPFTTANLYENYIFIGEGLYGYSGVVFSRKVTASLNWIEH